jgi:hypothetical protein
MTKGQELMIKAMLLQTQVLAQGAAMQAMPRAATEDDLQAVTEFLNSTAKDIAELLVEVENA